MLDSDEEGSDDDMEYSPASPTTPMSVQQLGDPPRTERWANVSRQANPTPSTVPDERRPRLPQEWSMTTTEVEDDFRPMLNLLEQEELLSHELQ